MRVNLDKNLDEDVFHTVKNRNRLSTKIDLEQN